MVISLNWNPELNAAEYRIYRRSDEDASWSLVTSLPPNTVVFVDSIPVGDTDYFYRISAIGQMGVLAFSESSSAIHVKGSNFIFESSGKNGDEFLYEIDFISKSDSSYRFEFSTSLQSDEWSPQPYISIPGDTEHTNPITNTSGPVKLYFSFDNSDLPIFFRLVKEP
jgi:hypothetical protein